MTQRAAPSSLARKGRAGVGRGHEAPASSYAGVAATPIRRHGDVSQHG
jgi:hypothetical protein